ncbi:MAG TPA: hypothetical protein V6C72_03010, partial [Chroococcales cyanobacterium]
MSQFDNLGNFLTSKLKTQDVHDNTSARDQNAQFEACSLLMDATAMKAAMSAHTGGHLNDAVTRYLGNCCLELFNAEAPNSKDDSSARIAQARAIADRVQASAASGDISGSGEGELLSAYSMAS